MDYERKKRWARYHSVKCKMYLRNDFNYECAYCRLREQDTGVLIEEFFEKDHFIPQSTEENMDVDSYDNMIYACSKCNGTKSNQKAQVLLNPCEDDIYGGSDPHIKNLGRSGNYELAGNTPQGRQYITSLQLNSKFYRDMREQQERSDQKEQEWSEIAEVIHNNQWLPDGVLKQLEMFVNKKLLTHKANLGDEAFRCGRTIAGMAFQTVLGILNTLSIPYELLYADNDVDVKIKYHEKDYLCEIVLNEKSLEAVNCIHIKKEKRKVWDELDCEWGILYYYLNLERLEFYRRDENGNIFSTCLKMSE